MLLINTEVNVDGRFGMINETGLLNSYNKLRRQNYDKLHNTLDIVF